MLHASPKKLKNGDWGALVKSADVQESDILRIETKSGKAWEARVTKVFWRGEDKAIVATKSTTSGRKGRGGNPNGRLTDVGKECDYCADGLSFGMKPGQRCPYCGGEVF